LNMACLVAIGYAFGFTHVTALVAAFAVAAISVILSPTPQGVGVVEAAIAAILTAHGCSLATATAIALVYRGIMFWMPFCIGAVLLSQSGFFADKKNPSEEQRAKDTAWVSGTIMLIVGLVNIGMALIPQTFDSPLSRIGSTWAACSSVRSLSWGHRARGAGRGTHPALPRRGRSRWACSCWWLARVLYVNTVRLRGSSAAGDVAVLEARRVRPSYRSARRARACARVRERRRFRAGAPGRLRRRRRVSSRSPAAHRAEKGRAH
ncbi:MAG: lysylphosphatidylglycerol synthase domain-containing protein, partial [Eggerthellaceae bacterium]